MQGCKRDLQNYLDLPNMQTLTYFMLRKWKFLFAF
jgi:hypothetical protein